MFMKFDFLKIVLIRQTPTLLTLFLRINLCTPVPFQYK